MKTQIALIILTLSLNSLAAFKEFSAPQKIAGTESLYRGSAPLGKADKLFEENIQHVIIFKNELRGEVQQEIEELLAAGYSRKQIHHIPMEWKKINFSKSCKQTIAALKVMISAEAKGENSFVHCTVGEDRTGMIAGLAHMLISGNSTEETFAGELCENGYSDGDRQKPASVVNEIENGLTPLFFAMGKLIEGNKLTSDNLDESLCDTISVQKVARRCH